MRVFLSLLDPNAMCPYLPRPTRAIMIIRPKVMSNRACARSTRRSFYALVTVAPSDPFEFLSLAILFGR